MLPALLKAMRPHQWVKNLLVFAPLMFAHRFGEVEATVQAVMAFAIFCLLSSSIYLLNDIRDVEADRAHPRKQHRPIASGALPVPVARLACAGLAIGSLVWSVLISDLEARNGAPYFAVPLTYFILQLAYTYRLKRMIIVDCLCIALGFLLRVHSGSVAIGVSSSSWLLLCTFFFSLLLAFSKRRNEAEKVSDGSGATRETMRRYSVAYLDSIIPSLAAVSILSYALYTLDPGTAKIHGSKNLMITVPLVVYGVYRYQYLVQHRGEGDDPARLLFQDRPLIICGLAYLVCALATLSIKTPLF